MGQHVYWTGFDQPRSEAIRTGKGWGSGVAIYADVVFLTNWLADGAILLTAARIGRQRPPLARVALAAALGAAYAAAVFAADVPLLYTFGAKAAVAAIMVTVAFGFGHPLRWTRQLAVVLSVNLAVVGGIVGLAFLLRSGDPFRYAVPRTDGGEVLLEWRLAPALLLIFFVFSLWLYRGVSAHGQKRGSLETHLVSVRIEVGGESASCPGLVDTGNRLYEPITGIPVMVAEAGMWRDRLPAGWTERLRTEPADRLVGELDGHPGDGFPWKDRLRLVPYRSVGGEMRLMLAIRPDAVEITLSGGRVVRTTRVLVGLEGGSLSPDGVYRAVVHPDLTQAGAEPPASSTRSA
jgi:stage II sporulation protein GA (sporulation sigma-E factor processing peptidase)